MEELTKAEEPRVRMKRTQNFKGELGYEVVTRADTVEEASKLLKQAWGEVKKDGN